MFCSCRSLFEAMIEKVPVPCAGERWQSTSMQSNQMKEALWCFPPAATDGGDGFEAARGELAGACVAAIHGPVEEVDLVGVELQEQDDDFAAQLVDLRQWQRQERAQRLC